MWKLLKSEYLYYKLPVLLVFIFFIPWLVLNMLIENFNGHVLRVLFLLLPILGIIVEQEEKRSRKNPLYLRLPLKVRGIACFRYLMWIAPWMIMVMLYAGSTVIRGSQHISVWHIMVVAGTMIVYMSAVTLSLDVQYCVRQHMVAKWFQMSASAMILLAMSLYLLISFSPDVRALIQDIVMNPVGSIVICIAAVLVTVVGIRCFELRRSYLE